jgi:hypothetical protein
MGRASMATSNNTTMTRQTIAIVRRTAPSDAKFRRASQMIGTIKRPAISHQG